MTGNIAQRDAQDYGMFALTVFGVVLSLFLSPYALLSVFHPDPSAVTRIEANGWPGWPGFVLGGLIASVLGPVASFFGFRYLARAATKEA